jgi:hypothetical protein
MRASAILLGLILAAGLTGCGDRASVTRHEPGVYKGDRDDQATMVRTAEQEQVLAERFDGQRDR